MTSLILALNTAMDLLMAAAGMINLVWRLVMIKSLLLVAAARIR